VVAWLSAVALISVSVSYALTPGRLDEAPSVTNPLGIEFARSALEFVYAWGLLLLPLCFAASALSMVLRFGRAAGEVRQQIKWFAAAAVLQTTAFSFSFVMPWGVVEDLVALAFAGLPVAVGIAILRHRLYDIDVVINRALVYGPLTAMLAAVYFASVIVSQYAFRAITGQESQLAVVASTLIIAAAFVPLRRRVQGFIDRRFYRRKYDAIKTLEASCNRPTSLCGCAPTRSRRLSRQTSSPLFAQVSGKEDSRTFVCKILHRPRPTGPKPPYKPALVRAPIPTFRGGA
jgi:hypothetical protein